MKLSEAMDDARTCGRALRFAAITHGYKVAWAFFRNHRVKTRLRAEVNRLEARLDAAMEEER